jgi:hypothetical protein
MLQSFLAFPEGANFYFAVPDPVRRLVPDKGVDAGGGEVLGAFGECAVVASGWDTANLGVFSDQTMGETSTHLHLTKSTNATTSTTRCNYMYGCSS